MTAKVLKIDAENRRVSLGIKQVNDIWGDWFKQSQGRAGREGQGFAASPRSVRSWNWAKTSKASATTRRSRNASGAMTAPADASVGRTRRPLKSAGPLEPGKEYEFKIIKINPEQRRIGLSYRAAVRQAERQEIEQYRSTEVVGDGDDRGRDSSPSGVRCRGRFPARGETVGARNFILPPGQISDKERAIQRAGFLPAAIALRGLGRAGSH